MDHPVILGYWNIRGILGEVTRLFLEYLEIPYVQHKYITMDDKMQWFENDKPNLKASFPNLPYLQDGSTIICESDAILFHLAEKKNRLDLFGNNNFEKKELFALRGVLKVINFFLNNFERSPHLISPQKLNAFNLYSFKFLCVCFISSQCYHFFFFFFFLFFQENSNENIN